MNDAELERVLSDMSALDTFLSDMGIVYLMRVRRTDFPAVVKELQEARRLLELLRDWPTPDGLNPGQLAMIRAFLGVDDA